MDIEGKMICHKCDNPSCVNPNHFFIGTQKENMTDAWNKGRLLQPLTLRGEDVSTAVLTAGQVKKIKSSKMGCRRLARKYNISKTTAQRIRRGDSWAHIKV